MVLLSQGVQFKEGMKIGARHVAMVKSPERSDSRSAYLRQTLRWASADWKAGRLSLIHI